MEDKHEKVVLITRTLNLGCLGLMLLVSLYDKGAYSDEATIATLVLVTIGLLAFLYRLNFELKNKIFDVKKNLISIVFLLLTVLVFLFFLIFE